MSGESRLPEEHVNLLRQVVEELNKGMLEWMDKDVQQRLKKHYGGSIHDYNANSNKGGTIFRWG